MSPSKPQPSRAFVLRSTYQTIEGTASSKVKFRKCEKGYSPSHIEGVDIGKAESAMLFHFLPPAPIRLTFPPSQPHRCKMVTIPAPISADLDCKLEYLQLIFRRESISFPLTVLRFCYLLIPRSRKRTSLYPFEL